MWWGQPAFTPALLASLISPASGVAPGAPRWRGGLTHAPVVHLRPQWALALLLALAMMLAGCSYSTGPVTPTQAPDIQQILHDALITGVAGKTDLATYDPAFAQDQASLRVISLVFPGLVTLDSHLVPQNWAAESIDISADGLTYTFHIRRDLKFADGEPIDASAFAFAFNRILNPCLRSPLAFYLFPIKNAATFNAELCANPQQDLVDGTITTLIGAGQPLNAQDPQTLVITLAQPASYFLTSLTYPALVAEPVALIQQYGDANWTSHLTDHGGFGGSLFLFSTIDHKGHITLIRNASFWGARPKLREIDFTIYSDETTEYAAYLAGKNDIGYPPASQYSIAKSASGFQMAFALQLRYLGVNWNVAPFNNLGFRQAFALAIEKQSLAQSAFQGAAIATNHLIPQGLAAYNPALKAPDGTQTLTGNVTQAKALATAYATANCGGAFSGCPAITISVPNDSPSAQAAVNAISAMWTAVAPGYPMSVQAMEPTALLQAEANHQAQCFYGSWLANYPSAEVWTSLQFGAGALNNAGSVSAPDANTLMANADAEADPTQQARDYQAAEQLLVTQVAWIPLAQTRLLWRTRSWAQGFALDAMGAPAIYDVIPNIFLTAHH